MSGFFAAPQFEPVQPPLFDGAVGDVLTITSGGRAWAPASGGGVKQGYLGSYLSAAPAGGTYTNYNPAGFGPAVGRLDIDTTAGNVTIASLVAGTDGQLLNIRNIGANTLTLASPGFQFPGSFTVPQYDAVLVCYYGGSINKWCLA